MGVSSYLLCAKYSAKMRIKMDKILEKYLDTVDRHLRPLPASERVDIVKEIKGSMMEMQSEGISAENIAQKLGDPRELAKAYLGDLLSNGTGLSLIHISEPTRPY